MALACLARAQFSIFALTIRSCSALTRAASASAACFFLASMSLSTPLVLGPLAACAAGASVGSAPGSSGAAGSAAALVVAAAFTAGPARLTIFFSGTSGGGARSLKTLRPSLSSHCHWARAEVQDNTKNTGSSAVESFIQQSVAAPEHICQPPCKQMHTAHRYNMPFGALTCAFSAKR